MLRAIRGTRDILPQEVKTWLWIEECARDIFSIYNYKEIRTPIIEEASLFIRSIGDATDIVQKEMYVFSDRGERHIALRPEATASIVRAYLENSLYAKDAFLKLFYIGPMFRSERPQKGRQRQFHQLGVEAIGADNPYIDAEVISLAVRLLARLGINNIELKLNSLGCKGDKLNLIEKNKAALSKHLPELCAECNSRYNKNVLRVSDCKNEACQKVVESLEPIDFLCSDCKAHFEIVKNALEGLGIDFKLDTRIVRGLDYYTKTVFEITQKDLGSKDAICAGGRYNNLIQDMGGPSTPAVGFAFGIERLCIALKDMPMPEEAIDFFIVTTGNRLYDQAFKLMAELRSSQENSVKKISFDLDYEGKSLKAQMKKAQKLNSRFVIMLGEEEEIRSKVIFKDMASGEQEEVDNNAKAILTKIKEKGL